MKEKWMHLLADEVFAKKMCACENTGEMLDLLAKNGVRITAEELTARLQTLRAGCELSDDALGGVTGGAEGKLRMAHEFLEQLYGGLPADAGKPVQGL